MDKTEFDTRWNKAFSCERFQGLLYKNPLPDGMKRKEKFDNQKNDYQKSYYKKNKEKCKEQSKKSYQKHKEQINAKARQKRQNQRLLKAMRQRVQDQKILLENDESTRAYNELKNFTPEERRAFDEWERQNKEHTVY